jgi:hypothetical protein
MASAALEGEGYTEVMKYMEEKIERCKSKEEAWETSSEEEDYDYGQECEEVYHKR